MIAYAFLAVAFIGLLPPVDFQMFLESTKQLAGYELYGYWLLYNEPDVDQFIQDHVCQLPCS